MRTILAATAATSMMVGAASAADFGGSGAAGVALSRGYVASPGLGRAGGEAAREAAPAFAPSGLRDLDVDFTAVAPAAPARPVDR